MKLSKLLGLFFLSLLLTACWLSTLPSAEDPWDENKVTAPDTGSALGGGGVPPNGGGFQILILHGGPHFAKIFDFHIVIVPRDGAIHVEREEAKQSSVASTTEPRIAVPGCKSVKAR